jgi:ribokinase
MTQRPSVTVLGSMNTDISLSVPHLPAAGETVLAQGQAAFGAGGKGANQAVAAARLGASVRMAGCCGDDAFGTSLRQGLTAEGVDTSGVRVIAGVASGLALICVDLAGENSIAVAPGANAQAGEEEAAAAFAAPCDTLVLCAEIPVATLVAALRRARGGQPRTVLNLAPVPPGAGELLAAGPDWLVVNAAEASALLGQPVTGVTDARLAAQSLARDRHAVVTLGPAGAVAVGPALAAPVTVTGFAVDSVDSVGAGDAFVGALAVMLASQAAPETAVRAACAAGAAATTKRGAAEALPHPAGIHAATGFTWPLAQ